MAAGNEQDTITELAEGQDIRNEWSWRSRSTSMKRLATLLTHSAVCETRTTTMILLGETKHRTLWSPEKDAVDFEVDEESWWLGRLSYLKETARRRGIRVPWCRGAVRRPHQYSVPDPP
jgi:hypothetical protein